MTTTTTDDRLAPYVSGLAVDWLESMPATPHRRIAGSLAFVDISGFTSLTERLAAHGKLGAEEMSDLLNATFATLLASAYSYGALLVKWGGDAVLLLFEGPEHALLACRAADEMRRTMRQVGRLQTSAGVVQLRMSVGISSGEFDFFLVGDRHRELLVTGPASTETAHMEQVATAGEIVVARATAALLPAHHVGANRGDGYLLRGTPAVDGRCRYWPPPADETDLGLFLDPAIRDHLRTEVGDSEHRHVAVGFVEVSDVDDLLRRQGPGAVAGALHALVTRMQHACDRHHVTFWETDISADGFKIMLVAGAPRGTGRDEDGMIRAAAAVLDGYDGPFGLRIGVNCGRVFSGAFGPPFRRTWSVKGDAVNLAARVMGKAAHGQLLATKTLLELTSSGVDQTPLEPFQVKGKRHPVQASLVTSVSAHRHGHDVVTGTLVGRDGDRAVVSTALDAARAGAGRIVTVAGEPGIGKSCLVEHVLADAAEVLVLRAAGDDYERSTPYFVARQLLRQALAVPVDAPEPVVGAALERTVAAIAPHLRPWLPLLAVAAGVRVEDNDVTAAVEDQFRAQRTAALAAELFEQLLDSPAVLSVDDAHCCDDASVELLRRVARMMARRPWLLVVSGRTVPVVLDELASARLILGPIAVDAATELVLLDDVGQTLPPHVVRGVVARADGNPLFLRTLSAVAAAAGSDTGLPETLEELLTAQIDELAPALRRTLRVAAVLGMRFEESLVAELLGDSVHDGTWHDLADFIDVEQAGTCRFRTALARDAAYEGLPYRTRVDLHRRAGDLLRARAGSEADELAEPLSLHYFAGQRFADAWRYARIAADRARHAFANAEALTLYERARAAARKLPDLPTADVADVLESLADMHARLLAIEPAVAAYREARRLTPADDVLRRARLALRAGLVVAHGGAPDRFNRWMSLAQRELGAGDPDNPELGELDARIWVERAYLQFNLGRDARATTMCERAIALAERLGVGAVIGRGLHLLDLLDVRGGRGSDEARMQRVLALFVRAGDLSRQGGTWNHLGLTAYFRGEWGRAVGCYREAQQLFERCGYEWAAAMAAANVGEILLDQGRLDEAEPLVAAALRVCRVSGAPTDVGFTAALLGTLYARKGRHLDATELLSEAGASYAVTGERFELVDVDLRAAEALLLTGRTVAAGQRLAGAAERLLEAAAAAGVPTGTGGQLPMTPLTARLLRLEGVATQQLGETDVGVAQLRESLAVARRRRSQHDLLLALASLRDADAVAAHEAAELEVIALDLGITWLPTPPRRMADPGEIVVPAQRTTRQERV